MPKVDPQRAQYLFYTIILYENFKDYSNKIFGTINNLDREEAWGKINIRTSTRLLTLPIWMQGPETVHNCTLTDRPYQGPLNWLSEWTWTTQTYPT